MKDELINKAKELGIDVTKFDDDSKLEVAIKEKEEDNKKKETDPEYLRSEMKKAFEARDRVKEEKRRLAQKVEDLEKRLSSSPKQEDYEKITQELSELRQKQKEVDEAKEQEELKTKSETEKLQISFNKQMEKLKKEMEEQLGRAKAQLDEYKNLSTVKDEEIGNLRQHRLRADIMAIAAKMKAYNPAQIYKLLRDEFEYDKDSDEFIFNIKNSKGTITDYKSVEERVQEFLEDPDNDNLVEASVHGGSGHRETFDKSKDKDKNKDRDLSEQDKELRSKYNPKDPSLLEKAAESDLSIEDYITYVLIPRDKAKARRGK